MKKLALLPLLLLAGCGFHPLYQSQNGHAAPQFAAMDQIDINLIPDRSGQILRQALEADLQRDGAPGFYRYHLNTQYSTSVQAIGMQPDSSNSRVRYFATVNWSLVPEGNRMVILTKGTVEATDSVNVIDNQFFALSLSSDTLEHRLARELAARITEELAIYFRKHPAAS
jgi:LPS-assembly lipoprotein